MNWKLGKLIKNKTYKLWGVNIFDYQWTDTGETVHRKDFTIYTIDVEGTTHTFAAIGRGLNTWLFYVGE